MDPCIRAQHWGANLQTNKTGLESHLRGLSKPLDRDLNTHLISNVKSKKIKYPTCIPFTDQPRSTHPAWMLRDNENYNNFQYLYLDPQENIAMPFNNNISTRILEKNNS